MGILGNDERRTSRRVSFANNLFLQELKPDGTTQLITEPFKNVSDDQIENFKLQNESTEQQPPVVRNEKKRKSTKSLCSYLQSHYNLKDDNDYATVFNTSVNRTNAKRKFEEMQRRDLDTLFYDDDMELTKLDTNKDSSSKFTFNSTAFSSSNMNLTFVNTNKENSFYPVPKGFVASSTVSNNNQANRSTLIDKENLVIPSAPASISLNKENSSSTQMYTLASMDLTSLNGNLTGQSKNTLVYSSPNDMEITDLELNKTNDLNNTQSNNEMSLTNLTSASTYFRSNNTSVNTTSLPSDQTLHQNLSNISQDTSIVRFPIKNPKLNNLTMFAKPADQTCSSEMDLTNLGRTQQDQTNDDMELTDMELNTDNSILNKMPSVVANLSSSNDLNTTNLNNYMSSSSSQRQTTSSSDKTLDQDSSVQLPIRNSELNDIHNNVSAFNDHENVIPVDKVNSISSTVQYSQTDKENILAPRQVNQLSACNDQENKTFNATIADNTTINQPDVTNNQSNAKETKTQMFNSVNMDLTSLNGEEKTYLTNLNNLSTTTAADEETKHDKTEILNEKKNTCIYSSPDDMELTDLDLSRDVEITGNQMTSKMDLTNLSSLSANTTKTEDVLSQATGDDDKPLSQVSSVFELPIKNSNLNDITSKYNQTLTSEMDITKMVTVSKVDSTLSSQNVEPILDSKTQDQPEQNISSVQKEVENPNVYVSNCEYKENEIINNIEDTDVFDQRSEIDNEENKTLSNAIVDTSSKSLNQTTKEIKTQMFSSVGMDLTNFNDEAKSQDLHDSTDAKVADELKVNQTGEASTSEMELTEIVANDDENEVIANDPSVSKMHLTGLFSTTELNNSNTLKPNVSVSSQKEQSFDERTQTPENVTTRLDESKVEEQNNLPTDQEKLEISQIQKNETINDSKTTFSQKPSQSEETNCAETQMFNSVGMDLTSLHGDEKTTNDEENSHFNQTTPEQTIAAENRNTVVYSPEDNDMELTDMEITKDNDVTNNSFMSKMSVTALSSFSKLKNTTTANVFLQQPTDDDKTLNQVSSVFEFPIKNSNLNNITSKSKYNQTLTSEMDISNTTRILSPKCLKLDPAKLAKSFSASRRLASNAWALKKDRLHSTLNFKNQSLLRGNNIEFNDKLSTPQFKNHHNMAKVFVNKTMPINVQLNTVESPETADATQLLDENMEATNFNKTVNNVDEEQPTKNESVVVEVEPQVIEPQVIEQNKTIGTNSIQLLDEDMETTIDVLPNKSVNLVGDGQITLNESINKSPMVNVYESTNLINTVNKTFNKSAMYDSIEVLMKERDASIFGLELSRNHLSIKESLNFDEGYNKEMSKLIEMEKEHLSTREENLEIPKIDSSACKDKPENLTVGILVNDIISDVEEEKSIDESKSVVNRTKTIGQLVVPQVSPFSNLTMNISSKKPKNSTFVVDPKVAVNHDDEVVDASVSHKLKSTFVVDPKVAVNHDDEVTDTSVLHKLKSTFVVQPSNETVNSNTFVVDPKVAASNHDDEVIDTSVSNKLKNTFVVNQPKEAEEEKVDNTMEVAPVITTNKKDNSIRRTSLFNNLSNLERELNRDTMNDSVLAFQTQTDFAESTQSNSNTQSITNSNVQQQQNSSNNTQPNISKLIVESNNTNYRMNELEEQIVNAKNLMLEKSFFTDFMKDAMMYEDDKIKSYFNQHNRNVINLKAFNNHIALQLELETQYENEYSNILDMRLVFDFDKPKLKFWSDKFYLFYNDRREHKAFIEILKISLTKQFDQFKIDLLSKYNTTEFLINIGQETELFLQKASVFAKDIKATTLKFINYEFKLKQDDTFE